MSNIPLDRLGLSSWELEDGDSVWFTDLEGNDKLLFDGEDIRETLQEVKTNLQYDFTRDEVLKLLETHFGTLMDKPCQNEERSCK